jgi:amidophosphoribosyltransferase
MVYQQLSSVGSGGDRPRHHCGVIGVFGVPDAARHVYSGLYALQHRGQESAGIIASNGRKIQSVKGLGLLSEAIQPQELEELPGHIAVGHVRYSTTGAKRVQNIQPLVVEYSQGIVAIAHNGNLTNARSLRELYESRGSIFQTATDSEIVVHLLADPEHIGVADPLGESLQHVSGAFSLLLMTSNRLMAARDPHGFRPLAVARMGDGYVVASETCAFDLLGADYLRDIEPGEIISVDEEKMRSWSYAPARKRKAQCLFEHIYFARPDSKIFGETVHNVRVRLGENLAEDSPAEADAVISVPHSGDQAALGYARRSGLPLDMGFVCNRYVGRTFIQPPEENRSESVEIKLNVIADAVRGKRLVVVDDSLVRGTTCRARLSMLREAGAEELHMRISAPPIRHPCYYGIDFPDTRQLLAANNSVEEIREFLGVDSFAYQTVDGLLDAVSGEREDYCLACFNGNHPVTPEENMDRLAMERQ